MYRDKYEKLKTRRGAGRARVAFMRRIFGVMRRMLLSETKFIGVERNYMIQSIKNIV